MEYTEPVAATFTENCTQDTVVDQSEYQPAVAPGLGGIDTMSPGEPPVVQDQSAYPFQLSYSDLPNSSATEWRLILPLRQAAAPPGTDFINGPPFDPSNPGPGWDIRTPLDTLKQAATDLADSGGDLDFQHRIRAAADLAVTGRLAYETLAEMGFNTPGDVVVAMGLGEERSDAALKVVQRAQQVAWAIRGNPVWREHLRSKLGWIGVSGEDDAPHRPCNVPSLPAPQYDIHVPVGGRTYTTRVTIAEPPFPAWPVPFPELGDPPTFLPPDDVPAISPDSDLIFVYMPGDASRAEEAGDLILPLINAAAEQGKKASVISFDLIGWGYSARKVIDDSGDALLFDQTLFPVAAYPADPPALQFVEDFVVSLIETLHRDAPNIDLTKVVPIGGSLGGNLALRLGRRSDLSWLNAVCGWSPGSVWPSKAANPDASTLAGDGAAAGAAAGAVAGALFGGIGAVGGAIIGAVVGALAGAKGGPAIDRATIGNCTAQMNAAEDASQRGQHFADVFDNDTFPQHVRFTANPLIDYVPPQALMWYRDDWQPCKDVLMCQDRLDRREVYDATFRRWHWRIGGDQLIYSHRDKDLGTGAPRYLLNTIPMLLAAGEKDDYKIESLNLDYAAIYTWTRDLAKKMTVPGTSLFLKDTGHSIHNERPIQLAHSIMDFLARHFHRPGTWVGGWSELYSDNDNLAMLDVARNADGRLEVFGVNAQGHIWHTWQVQPNNGWVGGWSELYSDNDNLTSLRVAANADGRLEAFGVNAQGHIWHTWQVQPNNGWVGGWSELYSDNDNLAMLDVARNADGRLEVFGVNAQGHIWHTWQVQPGGAWAGGWSELYSDLDNLTSLRVAANADGRLEVFGVNAQGHIWHTWQIWPGGAWTEGWSELYSDNDNLAMLDVARNADGRLEVFGVNAQGHIWHTWQVQPNNGWVGGWSELYSDNDNLTSLRVAANADGRLEVFGVNAQGHIWHTWQIWPGGTWAGGWSELYSDNDNLTSLRVAANADGRLEVFGVNAQGHIWHTWQT
jgi:hypothetical protein